MVAWGQVIARRLKHGAAIAVGFSLQSVNVDRARRLIETG